MTAVSIAASQGDGTIYPPPKIPVADISGLGDLATRNVASLTQQATIHTEYFFNRPLVGAAAGAPTVASIDATISTGNDAEKHFVGAIFADTLWTAARFGFHVPNEVGGSGTDLTPKICFLLGGVPGASPDTVEIILNGARFTDGQGITGGDSITSQTIIDVANYNGKYIIQDLTAFGFTFNPGDYVQGFLMRDAQVANTNDTFAALIGVCWVAFNGTLQSIV